MPPDARYRHRLPPAVVAGVQGALLQDEPASYREIAARYGVANSMVARLAERLGEIDAAAIERIRAELPRQAALLTALHLDRAIQAMDSDVRKAQSHTISAKFAAETLRLAGPPEQRAGVQVLQLVQQFNVSGAQQPPAISVTAQHESAASDPSGGDTEQVAENAEISPATSDNASFCPLGDDA